MLAYTTLGASNLNAAVEFYTALTESMGWKKLMGTDRIVFFGSSLAEAALAICTPYDEEAPSAGNGVMVAFHGGSPEGVDALYEKAISLGATCDGAPGQRIPDVFYGAYVRDAEGNKLCFCHFG
ncbi:VOC family protein [Luminiphilus sp.]|nr:VOC family protein [Luminiphilus sp.]